MIAREGVGGLGLGRTPLPSGVESGRVRRRVLAAARALLGRSDVSAVFEHGH